MDNHELYLAATQLEDCILEGMPSHSGYKGIALKIARKVQKHFRDEIRAEQAEYLKREQQHETNVELIKQVIKMDGHIGDPR